MFLTMYIQNKLEGHLESADLHQGQMLYQIHTVLKHNLSFILHLPGRDQMMKHFLKNGAQQWD